MASASERAGRGGGGRAVAYGIIAVLCLGVVAAAYYQEEIGYFFKLRTWDSSAPGRTVVQFLEAGQKGDQKAADAMVGTQELKPLVENGKGVGYLLPTNAGVLELRFAELAPQSPPKEIPTEYVYAGEGAAMVKVPDRTGKAIEYRLELRGSDWKIMEIRTGRRRP